MTPGKMIFATSLVSAVIVLGVALPLSYLGFQGVGERIEAGQTDMIRVVLDLKSETLREIKSFAAQSTAQTAVTPDQVSTAISTAVTTALGALGDQINGLQGGQAGLARDFAALRTQTVDGIRALSDKAPAATPVTPAQISTAVTAALGQINGTIEEIKARQAAAPTAITPDQISAAVAAALAEMNGDMKEVRAGQAGLLRRVADLRAEAIRDIGVIGQQAAARAAITPDQVSAAVTAALGELNGRITAFQQEMTTLRRDQEKFRAFMELRTEGLMASATPAPAPLPAQPGARDDSLNQTVYFALGQVTDAAPEQIINPIVANIVEYSRAGHCLSNVMGFSDTLGGDQKNLELSLQRAEHVAALLRDRQIAVGAVKGWGERWLNIHTVDGVKNDRNRRVVIETLCRDTVAGTGRSLS
ncbi:MAG: hypothetical protein HQ483_00720 [Rhodospirillales bacterium]|nr:hypothetical protein [Rhodospirillales bacterium]